jgi:hypothetical protein
MFEKWMELSERARIKTEESSKIRLESKVIESPLAVIK